MYYTFFLYIVPLLILFGLWLVLDRGQYYYYYFLKLITLFTMLTFVYAMVLGLITQAFMLETHFDRSKDYPSLVLSRLFSGILLYIVLPLNVLNGVVWTIKKMRIKKKS